VAFEIGVENLSEAPATLSLADRVPVSEDREVDVRSVRVGPTGEPDSKGLIRWEVNLAPRERKSFNVEYTLEYPSDWLERNKAQSRGGIPSPVGDSTLMKQIQVLESKF
jgi:hypothetical protein